jgi:LytR cell envelope-related transcriptional attenuator
MGTMRSLPDRFWPAGYHRRRGGPAAVVIAVLAALSLITWTVVLIATGGGGGGRCNTPADPANFGEVLVADELADVPPVPASAVPVRVLNGGGQRGQANLVASLLGDLGFTEAAPPANDPRYPKEDLSCRGQLRFGPAGAGAVRTLSLVLPCTELVRDGRTDGTVDLSIGTVFGDVSPSATARKVLEQLAAPAPAENTGPGGDTGPAPPRADPKLVEQAASADC